MKDPVIASDGITYEREATTPQYIHGKCRVVWVVIVVLIRERSVERTLWHDRAVQLWADSMADTIYVANLRCMYVLHLWC